MGYTHYWYRPETLDAERFASFAHDCRDLALKWEGPIALEYDESEIPPAFNDETVRFNGIGENAHETFFISQRLDLDEYSWTTPDKQGRWFDFCKTARKPYDTLVTACLIAFKHHFPECEVHSDGDWYDWMDGRILYARLFPDREMPVVLAEEATV